MRRKRDTGKIVEADGPRPANSSLFVAVVDDDVSVRESLPDLLAELGFPAQAYPSADAYLACGGPERTRCLIVDVAMPGKTGPALQRQMTREGRSVPTIFITAHRDEAIRQHLMERGAVECLFKPFTEAALLAALRDAIR